MTNFIQIPFAILFCVFSTTAQFLNPQNDFQHHTTFDMFDSPYNNFVIPASNYRLNLTVKPLHYHLRMRPVLDEGYPNLEKFSVPSSVLIQAQSVTNVTCNTITLHQRNLTINLQAVTVKNAASGRDLQISNQTFEYARDLYTITVREGFNFGDNLEIYIPFTTHLSQTENTGVYLGHYTNQETNETVYLATTKLEPYHARKVFPLFDEPSLKATFSISVGRVEAKYHSLSNMEIMRTERDSEFEAWVWDHYQESVLMSPYLVCVIVSDFDNHTVQMTDGRTVSTWAPKHDIDAEGGSYGAETGAKLVNFYQSRFKMNYALQKLDAVALPQFASGAMENFGLVTYRHAYLVWIPGENTEAERRKVTQVLSHEIVHQWYGNIVTCAWWSEIWLNEGFARYMQFWGMNHTIPEFLVHEAFVNDANQLAMVFDQGPLTHPVRNQAESTIESAAVFDRISYEKAASLLKMMEGFLGRDLLEQALVDYYLQKMKWGSAHQEDLFHSIQEAVVGQNETRLLPPGITVEHVMAEWTLESGFPLITVGAVNKNTIAISQEKFSLGTDKRKVKNTHWWVPVKVVDFQNSKQSTPDFWIPNNVSAVTYSREDLDTSSLLMINPDASSYYRVLYDARLTTQIKVQLDVDHGVISSSSRSQLIDDYFNLALGTYTGIETALQLTSYLYKEAASNVWTTVLVHLKPILAKFSENQAALEAFQRYFVPRIKGALGIIGLRQLNGERGINVTLRAQLLEVACQLNLPECLEYSRELMDQWMQAPGINPFPVDLRANLLCAAVKQNTSIPVINFLLSKLEQTRKDTQKVPVLNALACSSSNDSLSSLLQTALNPQSVIHPHLDQFLIRVAMNPVGRKIVFEFATKSLLESKISANALAATVQMLSGYWGKPENFEQLEKFIESNGNVVEPIRASLQTSLSTVERNIKWWGTFGNRIFTWLQQQKLTTRTNN